MRLIYMVVLPVTLALVVGGYITLRYDQYRGTAVTSFILAAQELLLGGWSLSLGIISGAIISIVMGAILMWVGYLFWNKRPPRQRRRAKATSKVGVGGGKLAVVPVASK